MKLEYLEGGSPDCPLILLYGKDTETVHQLLVAFYELENGRRSSALLHEFPGIEPINECKLFATTSSYDAGVSKAANENVFHWSLSALGWGNVAGLIEPFAKGSANEQAEPHFQWLDDKGRVSVLISTSRTW